MHRKFLLVVSFFILGSMLALNAAADGVYVELNPGASILADSDISGGGLSGEAEFDAGFVIGGAVGYRFLEDFRTEANFSYRENDVDKINSSGTQLTGAGDVNAFTAMANVYYDIDLGTRVKPYVGGGLGVARVEVNSDSSANVLIVDDDSVEFAWNVMVGVLVGVSDNVDLSGGYRYLGMTDPELDATLVGVGSGTIDAEIEIHEILFGLRYNF